MNNKKTILISTYGLGVGGIEKCLVNFLNVLPEDKFDIDLLLMNPEYDLKKQIKRKVNYIDLFKYVMTTTDTMKEIRKLGGIFRNIKKFVVYCFFRIMVKLHLKPWKTFKKIKKNYDIAISYSHNGYSPYYVIDKVEAKRKVLWYHNGAYEESKKKYDLDKHYYLKYNNVVAVSTDCYNILNNKFNFKSDQLIILKNIYDKVNVQIKAKEILSIKFKKNFKHIVTVGRLTKEKGADLAVEACAILVDEGYNICWHWVGDGNQKDFIEQKINEYGIEKHFILEGKQINPYPYMNSCDVYVQPSYYEAYSTTITEARILCKPIVTTDVGGMRDQILESKTGLIVGINSIDIADAIKQIITNDELKDNLHKNLCKEVFNSFDDLSDYYNSVLK